MPCKPFQCSGLRSYGHAGPCALSESSCTCTWIWAQQCRGNSAGAAAITRSAKAASSSGCAAATCPACAPTLSIPKAASACTCWRHIRCLHHSRRRRGLCKQSQVQAIPNPPKHPITAGPGSCSQAPEASRQATPLAPGCAASAPGRDLLAGRSSPDESSEDRTMEPRPALRGGGDTVSSSPSMGWLLLLGPGSCVHPLPPELLGGSCCSRLSQEGLTQLD